MLPDAAMKSPEVWEAMIAHGIPITALMRNLPRMTNVFGGPGDWSRTVASQLQDAQLLKKGRVHPVNVLVAMRTYASGHSLRGDNSWHPISMLVDALDAGFYNSFGAVEPTGKRILLGLDVSGSMTTSMLVDFDHKGRPYRLPISCREITSALAMVLTSTEPVGNVETVVFTSGGGGQPQRVLVGYEQRGRLAVPVYRQMGGWGGHSRDYAVKPFDISTRRRLDDVMRATQGLPHGGTDCALPFTWAMENNREFDAVIVLTDNESWAGPIHVHQAAQQYRNKVGHDVKLIAAAMTPTPYSVVDPKDTSGLNISGFDSAVPQLVGDFISGRV
jgi:60 kDa SS-A/Ro ribonucleoprotein